MEGRKIQLEYIKKHCPEAAQIPWQKYYPLNLNNYQRSQDHLEAVNQKTTAFLGSDFVDSEVVDSEYHDAVINNTFFLFHTKINVYFVYIF